MMQTWSREEIEARVRELGDWLHNLDLRGVRTALDHFLGDHPRFKKKRGADRVVAIQSMQRGPDVVEPVADDYPFREEDLFERDGFPKAYFVEEKYAGDPTNWWIPDRACVEAMLRSAGFDIEAHPEREVYLCKRQARGGQ